MCQATPTRWDQKPWVILHSGFCEEHLFLIPQPVSPIYLIGLVTCRAVPILGARTVSCTLVFEQCNGNSYRFLQFYWNQSKSNPLMWESCLGASEIPKDIAQRSCPLQGLQHLSAKRTRWHCITGGRICPTNAVKITSQTVSPCVSCVGRLWSAVFLVVCTLTVRNENYRVED